MVQVPRGLKEALKKAQLQEHFASFCKDFWSVADPSSQVIWGWHLDAVCDHFQGAVTGKGKPRLLVNVPPGTGKSLIGSVLFPAWVWLRDPTKFFITTTYRLDLTLRDSDRFRRLVTSEEYQKYCPITLRTDTKAYLVNSAGGERYSTALGSGGVTGYRADVIIYDDLVPAEEGEYNIDSLKEAVDYWNKVLSSRAKEPASVLKVGIQQRLHTLDPCGVLSEQKLADGEFEYDHLILPLEYDPEVESRSSIGFKDPRTEAGQSLFPAFFTPDVIDGLKVSLGPSAFEGQYNQKPYLSKGGIFETEYFRYYKKDDLPRDLEVILSVDAAFKGDSDSDYVVIQAWGASPRSVSVYLVEQWRQRATFTQTKNAIIEMAEKYPNYYAIYVEDKANGPAIIDDLKDRLAGLIAVNPEGGKISRANSVSGMLRAGNIFLPETDALWLKVFLAEVGAFPKAPNDDQVDCATQALIKLKKRIIII